MAGQWRPIHDHHAIDMIAYVIQYQSPIPDLTLSRLSSLATSYMRDLGLVSFQPISAVSLSMQVGAAATQQNRAIGGIILWSEAEQGNFDEQVQIDSSGIIYRISRYMPWEKQLDRLRSVLGPVLELLGDVTVPSVLRLEYLDRFWFDGKPNDADTSLLLSARSKYIASHILSRRSLWHSHTGAFLNSSDPFPHVLQLNVDALDVALNPNDAELSRAVHIVTAREDRLAMAPIDIKHATPHFIIDWADRAHSDLKPILLDILHSAMADRIGLSK